MNTNRSFKFWLLAITATAVVILCLLLLNINDKFTKIGMVEMFNKNPTFAKKQGREFPEKTFTEENNTIIAFDSVQPTVEKTPIILAWEHPWFAKSEGHREGTMIGKCKITYDRSKLKQAKAVLFHCYIGLENQLPWTHYRGVDQVFIWTCAEAPPVLKDITHILPRFDDFFNWTASYRYDADVVGSYGHFNGTLERIEKGKAAVDALIAKKEKMAIWMVGKCRHTEGAKLRFAYANKLREAGIEFDGYGACFHNQNELPKSNPEKTKNTIAKYKFYFAFENAIHCKDYITEKFWVNSLWNGAVPIVLGPAKEDVLKVAPLDSFIHVEDFKSHIELAEYLKFLDKNITEYRKYFRWREDETMTGEKMTKLIEEKYPQIQVYRKQPNLCEKVLAPKKSKTIHSLLETHINSNPTVCNTVGSFLKNLTSSEHE